MSESGCIEMLLGFENINIMNIKKMNKKSNYDFDYENIIRIFKKTQNFSSCKLCYRL